MADKSICIKSSKSPLLFSLFSQCHLLKVAVLYFSADFDDFSDEVAFSPSNVLGC